MSVRRLSCLIVLLGVCPFTGAFAQGQIRRGGGKAMLREKGPNWRLPRLDALERMTPEQQQRFIESLPAPRRAQAREMLGKWRDMSPQERARARRTLGEFRELPAERQQRIRMLYGEFNSLPAARQRVLRGELRRLRALEPEVQRERLESGELRDKYYAAELRLLGDLADALPALDPEPVGAEEEAKP